MPCLSSSTFLVATTWLLDIQNMHVALRPESDLVPQRLDHAATMLFLDVYFPPSETDSTYKVTRSRTEDWVKDIHMRPRENIHHARRNNSVIWYKRYTFYNIDEMYYYYQASHMSTHEIIVDRYIKADEANGSDWSISTSDKGQRKLTGSCINVKRNDTGSTDFHRELALHTRWLSKVNLNLQRYVENKRLLQPKAFS